MPEEQTEWTIIPCPARFVDRASGRTLLEVTLETTPDGAGAQVRLFGDDGREVLLLTQDAVGMAVYGAGRDGPHADVLASPMSATFTAEVGDRFVRLGANEEFGADLMLRARNYPSKVHGGQIEMGAFDPDSMVRFDGPNGHSISIDARKDRAVVAVQGRDRFVHALAAIDGEESGLLNVDLQPLDPREGEPTGLIWHPKEAA